MYGSDHNSGQPAAHGASIGFFQSDHPAPEFDRAEAPSPAYSGASCGLRTAEDWTLLGQLRMRMADPKGAVAALRRAADLMPDPSAARLAFAESALSAGSAPAAEALLSDQQSDPDCARLLARLRGEEERMDEALDHARQTPPRVPPEALDRPKAEPSRQRAPPHAAAAVPAAQLSPEDQESMDLVVSRLGALKEARRELRASRGRPSSPEAWVRKALSHLRAGEPNEAVQAYEEALLLHPEHAEISLALGELFMRLNRQSEAAGIFARALARSPEHAELRAQLSEALTDPRQANQPTLNPSQPETNLSGDLRVFRLEDLLEFLGLRRATGWLRLRGPQGRGQVRLFRGRLVEAQHPDQLPMRDEVTEEGRSIDHWIQQAKPRSDSSLARVLLNAERVPEDVEQLCRRRLEASIEVMLGWQQGKASFDVMAAGTPPPFDFSHQDILMSIYARQDEASRDLPRVTDD